VIVRVAILALVAVWIGRPLSVALRLVIGATRSRSKSATRRLRIDLPRLSLGEKI
jgi:hypothetical protein